MLLASLLVVAAVLLWPSASSSPDRSLPAHGWLVGAATDVRPEDEDEDEDKEEAGTEGGSIATVDAAADALVLTALALRSGLAPVEALEAVAAELPTAIGRELRIVASAHRWGQGAATAWSHVGEAWRPAALAWQAAERAGAAPAGVVLAAAERMRHQEASRVEAAVQRAGVLLVLPLGLFFLPGFAATTVVPVVLHLVRAAVNAN